MAEFKFSIPNLPKALYLALNERARRDGLSQREVVIAALSLFLHPGGVGARKTPWEPPAGEKWAEPYVKGGKTYWKDPETGVTVCLP